MYPFQQISLEQVSSIHASVQKILNYNTKMKYVISYIFIVLSISL
jgi:hypothetical protein